MNQFLDRTYDPTNYNCGHFVIDVWKFLTGEDITTLVSNFRSTGFAKTRKLRTRIEQPEDPCLVVMQCDGMVPHVGVYNGGKMIHIRQYGVINQRLESLPKHYKLSFYK